MQPSPDCSRQLQSCGSVMAMPLRRCFSLVVPHHKLLHQHHCLQPPNSNPYPLFMAAHFAKRSNQLQSYGQK